MTLASSAKLYEPLTLRGVTLRNRIALSPMCTYSSSPDGLATEWHATHYASRAVGGAGLIVTEAAAIFPEGRITNQDLGIWDDAQIEPLRRINRQIRAAGSVPGIQLAHAGRKASVQPPEKGEHSLSPLEGGWPVVAPSAIPFDEGWQLPQELTAFQIPRLLQGFRDAARRALEAGFEVLELHAAHGYLLHQFLSPLTNRRTDVYGGSFENRIRLTLEAVAAIREVWPERLPLFVRISATEWAEGGWELEQSVELAKKLAPLGVDLVDVSTGGQLPRVHVPVAPGYQVPFASAIRQRAGIATGAVGLITDAAQAEGILQAGDADLVLFGRLLLRDPYWPLRAAATLQQKIDWPVQYRRGAIANW
jgi:2,4-dienoyl-CoA reductase-like NADH-dependent reductase (Old Yellow Enzyme family)